MRGAARKQSSRQEWQNSNEGEEGAGGTFAGREGLAVLDVELAHVDVDLALPAPHGHLLVLRYLREPTRKGTPRVRLGF